MSAAESGFVSALKGLKEITIEVIGRRTGRTISLPVWFVLEGQTLYLLPVKGSQSQWFLNLKARPELTIRAGRQSLKAACQPIVDAKRTAPVADKFRAKYGAGDVARYYSGFDAFVIATLPKAG